MTNNFFVGLESFDKIQFNYYMARNRRDFVEAAQLLFEANANLPEEPSIKDLPTFTPPSRAKMAEDRYRGNREEYTQFKAWIYCNKYAPLIWRSCSIYRAQMLQQLSQE